MKNAILGLTLLTSLTSLAGECNLYDNHLSSMINTELRETRFSSGSQIKIFPENLDFGERNSLKAIENRGYRLVKLKTDASVEMVLPYYGECYAYHAESFGYNDSCKNAKWNLSIIDLKTSEGYSTSYHVIQVPLLGDIFQPEAHSSKYRAEVINEGLPSCE